jgi:hypothetical protein
MGNRVYTIIFVREDDLRCLLKKINIKDMKTFSKEIGADDYGKCASGVISFEAEEINCGEWEELEGVLIDHKIPYDKDWAEGFDFGSGALWRRNVDGKYQSHEYYDVNKFFKEFVDDLKKNLDDSEEIKRLLNEKHNQFYPFKIEKLEDLNYQSTFTYMDKYERSVKEHEFWCHLVSDAPDGAQPTGNYVNFHTHGVQDNFGHMDFQIVVNLGYKHLMTLAHYLVKSVKEGKKYEKDKVYTDVLDDGYPVTFIEVTETGRNVLRMIVPDKNKNLKEQFMDELYRKQYDLDLCEGPLY